MCYVRRNKCPIRDIVDIYNFLRGEYLPKYFPTKSILCKTFELEMLTCTQPSTLPQIFIEYMHPLYVIAILLYVIGLIYTDDT